MNADILAGQLDSVRIHAYTLQVEVFSRALGLVVSPRLVMLALTRDDQIRALFHIRREKEEVSART